MDDASMIALLRRPSSRFVRPSLACLALGASVLGCSPKAQTDAADEIHAVTGLSTPPATDDAPRCPSEQLPETRAPDVLDAHEHAAFWIATYPAAQGQAEPAPLLDASAIAALGQAAAAVKGGWRDPLGQAGADPALIAAELDERITWMRGQVEQDKYVEREAGAFARAQARVEAATAVEGPPLRVVAAETQLWCAPMTEGLFTSPIDLAFDRNRCASLHPGELIRALRRTPDHEGAEATEPTEDSSWIYVDAGHSVGWVEPSSVATLGPPLTVAEAQARRARPQATLTGDFEGLRAGTRLPIAKPEADGLVVVSMPGVDGEAERTLPTHAPVSRAPLPFTRARVFEQAFALLEQPYGWGGRDGARDCSRYTYDLFAQFGVQLARHSGVQAKLGTRSVDVSALDEPQKRAAIRDAASEGVVLLYMPGHIMLYLGQDGGLDYGISALSEYLTPCEGGEDTVHRLDKVAVTTLDVGRGTERRAFIERITTMAVFSPPATD